MADIWDWSSTASSNTTIDSINTNTGMSPANVDNVFRSIAAIVRGSFTSGLKDFLKGVAGAYLPIAYGGTGAGDAATALGNIGALSSAYRDLPFLTKSSAFTFSGNDRSGGYLYTGAAAAATLNPDSSSPMALGSVFVVRNNGSGALTITRGSGVSLKANGSTTSADAVLAIGGQATVIRWNTDDWTITGTGIS
jgi:hypothetical protein